ncbi:MAG: hypothetical protein RIM83_00660 [Allomuricauda sp.]
MKLNNFISIFLLSFIIINCSKDPSLTNEPDPEDVVEPTPEEPTPEEPVLTQEVYFTFTTDESFQTEEGQEDWLILHDNEGELLDFRSFEKGEQLIFEKRSDSIPDSFSVTVLKVQFPDSDECIGNAQHALQTYPEIEKGSIWTFPNNEFPDSGIPEKLGEFSFTVTDIPGTDESRLFQNSFVSTPWYYSYISSHITPNGTNTAFTINSAQMNLYENTKYLISIMDEELNLKYKFFESPLADEVLNYSFDEFQEYDSYAYLPAYPPNLDNSFMLVGQVKGENRSRDMGYLIQNIRHTEIQDPLPIGFLDEFDYYISSFELNFEKYRYRYVRFGEKPQIEIPNEPVVSISNTEVASFEMTTDLDYIRKSNRWRHTNSGPCSYTSWTIHSDQNNYPKNIALPQSITEQYDLMKIDELEFQHTTFYVQSESYHNFIYNNYEIPPTPDEIREYTEEIIVVTQ